jgi:predicted kinase
MKPLTPAAPHLIVMVGIPGSGKTTFAERFAKTFQAPYINVGQVERITRATASATDIALLFLDEVLKTNRTVVFEGATFSRTARTELARKAREHGYETLLVWAQTDPVEAKRRATKRNKDDSQLSDDEFDRITSKFTAPTQPEKYVVISGRHTYASQLKIVLKRLAGEQRADAPTDQPRPQRPHRNIILR